MVIRIGIIKDFKDRKNFPGNECGSLTTDLTAVTDPDYVNEILDKLENSGDSQRILYVEQPFPYDLEVTG